MGEALLRGIKIKLAFLLESSPFDSPALYDAYTTAEQALAQGDEISVVFLRADAVLLANPNLSPPSDEINLSRLWQDLQRAYHFPMIACVTSAQRRGVISTAPGFKIGGLGQWFTLSQDVDKIYQR